MKLRLLSCAVALAAGLAAATPEKPYRLTEVASVPMTPAAREILNEINEAFLLLGPQPAEFWAKLTREQSAQMREDAQQKIRALTLRYLREHPSDPLRWVAVQQALLVRPEFVTGFKPGFNQAQGRGTEFLVIDEAAKSAWEAELKRLEAELEAAPDVPWEIRERREFLALIRETRDAAETGPAARGAMERKIEAFGARYPEGRCALELHRQLLGRRTTLTPEAQEERWGRLAASPNRPVAEQARAELRRLESERKPMELAFTAVDGREVDLAKLRGKVVLVDFWATWCGPCIAELPNVKKVYAEYHAKGFEIVGIALENAQLKPTDTPEQAAAKLEKAKQVLTDFTTKENMPWPQYFDGKHWKNDISTRYAVSGIPAMFLLDQEGRLVTTSARGEKLEAEVKRLLKL